MLCDSNMLPFVAAILQVLRLLCGLLAAGNQDVVRSEQPMGGGRSDLVVYGLQGTPLLVVEYKQRHSGAASTHQQQDTMQVSTSADVGNLLHCSAVVLNCSQVAGYVRSPTEY